MVLILKCFNCGPQLPICHLMSCSESDRKAPVSIRGQRPWRFSELLLILQSARAALKNIGLFKNRKVRINNFFIQTADRKTIMLNLMKNVFCIAFISGKCRDISEKERFSRYIPTLQPDFLNANNLSS